MGLPATPTDATKQGDAKRAHIEVIRPENFSPKSIPLCFNPTEFQLQKSNTFQEVPIPGLNAPPIQYVRGASEKLTFEALVDCSDSMENVKTKYVDPLRSLLSIDGRIHAPPVVKFVWDTFEFTSVIESLTTTYTLFADKGHPVRAKLAFALKEFTNVKDERAKAKKQSPDLEKTYVVRRGDTLSRIAELAYGDPSRWRDIAEANAIADPRRLEAGALITIPRLGGAA